MEEASSITSGSPVLSPERSNVSTPTNKSFRGYTHVIDQSPLGPYEEEDPLKSPEVRQGLASNVPTTTTPTPTTTTPTPTATTTTNTPITPNDLDVQTEGENENRSETLQSQITCVTPTPTRRAPRGIDHWATSTTRYLKISNINPRFPTADLYKYLAEVGDVEEYNTSRLLSDGICVISYFDLRDAIACYMKCKAEYNMWILQFCSPAYFDMLGVHTNRRGDNRSADVVCSVGSGPRLSKPAGPLYARLRDFGAIEKFKTLRRDKKPTFFVAFAEHRIASNVVDVLDGQYLMGYHLRATIFAPERSSGLDPFSVETKEELMLSYVDKPTGAQIYSPLPIRPVLDTNLGYGYGPATHNPIFPEARPASPGNHSDTESEDVCGDLFTDPRVLLPVSTPKPKLLPCKPDCVHRLAAERKLKSPTVFDNSLLLPGKNVIDLDRIARGLDTRTTVMLRNIPNKVDQATLKDYVDETSRGLYNFLYLRIDFRNICNVGYAFINFLDPLDIIDFVKEKSGTRWNKFNSEKVLDVTYANIQGIDQLVEKFRNSSVMDQDPAYRPKLFHSAGPMAGQEMTFPPANNILKKCRSVSAAQQIGLFAPKLQPGSKGIWRRRGTD
ncbi:RNA recognition motif 2-domain-containing protein [Tricharina praecox]|uniref:RNA recognition motif 2-domain-containing protein n=1 Tax=Tricharina praecox TaxID=43433 RepID=UPI00221E6752|nr:RNA recognition motif 2-domain-containing protein [Tricharina praecox]KAI5854811.1 RNA recognition motif 2-domain-containing protein [Tricharina praecox]